MFFRKNLQFLQFVTGTGSAETAETEIFVAADIQQICKLTHGFSRAYKIVKYNYVFAVCRSGESENSRFNRCPGAAQMFWHLVTGVSDQIVQNMQFRHSGTQHVKKRAVARSVGLFA